MGIVRDTQQTRMNVVALLGDQVRGLANVKEQLLTTARGLWEKNQIPKQELTTWKLRRGTMVGTKNLQEQMRKSQEHMRVLEHQVCEQGKLNEDLKERLDCFSSIDRGDNEDRLEDTTSSAEISFLFE